MRKIKIAVFGALSDNKFKSKIEPLIDLKKVSKVYLYRQNSNPFSKNIFDKINYFTKFRTSKYIYYVYSFFSIFNLALKKKVNILIGVYFLPFGILVGIVGIITKTPYILILPGSDLKLILEKKHFLFILKKSYKTGVRGSNSLQKLKEIGVPEERIFILHNYFDLPKINDIDLVEKKWDIIFIGYFRKLKRLDVLLDVIQGINNTHQNIKCVMLGDGYQMDNVKQFIKEKKIEENVDLVGHKLDVLPYLKKSKIFLLTSESEGLPMVLVEAMSQGVPVVTSDINDISDVVKHNHNGFLVQSLKTKEYITYTNKLMNDDNLYLEFSKNARKSIEKFHSNSGSFEAIKLKWQEVISEKIL